MLLRCLTLGAVLLAPSRQTPDPVRYRIEQTVQSRVDLSAFGQGEQVQEQTVAWFATARHRDSAGTRLIDMALDSVRGDFIPAASRDSLRGARYRLVLGADGRVLHLGNQARSAFGALFEAQLNALYPIHRPGARVGQSLTDTLSFTSRSPQGETTTSRVATFTHRGAGPWQGGTATRVENRFSFSVSGTMATPGGPADMVGKGSGSADYYLNSAGIVVGSTTRMEGDATVTMAFSPAPIPVKTLTTATLTVLR